MAKRVKPQRKPQSDETLVDIVEVRDQAQDFLEEYGKWIFGGILALVLVAGGIFAYRYAYQAPRQTEASAAMAQAQAQFERDSFRLALFEPGGANQLGFADIVSTYGGTPAANLANYYAGVSLLYLGEFDAALDYLKSFDPAGEVTPAMKFGAMGDAYAELNDADNALKNYRKAADAADENEVLAPYFLMKLGMYLETQNQPSEALEAYQEIRDEYPDSPYSADAEKYIARVTPRG